MEAASGQVTGSWGTRKTAGDRQLLDWAEGMGLLSTVNGRRPGEPAPGLLSVRAESGRDPRPLGSRARFDNQLGWDASRDAMQNSMGCRDVVRPHSSIRVERGVWRQQGQRHRGSTRAILPILHPHATLRSHTLSGEMQGLPTKDGVHGENR